MFKKYLLSIGGTVVIGLALASNSIAGRTSDDPQIAAIRAQFMQGTPPEISDLAHGSNQAWDCAYLSAKKLDYTVSPRKALFTFTSLSDLANPLVTNTLALGLDPKTYSYTNWGLIGHGIAHSPDISIEVVRKVNEKKLIFERTNHKVYDIHSREYDNALAGPPSRFVVSYSVCVLKSL